jgi:glycosyltransferase involved in cell wall biosynthesis
MSKILNKGTVIILGKTPPPYYGPAIATDIILRSSLRRSYKLIHIDTLLNSSVDTFGRFKWNKIFLLFKSYIKYIKTLKRHNIDIILLPISQAKGGLIKDSIYILIASLNSKRIILHLRGSALLDRYNSFNPLLKMYFAYVFHRCSAAIVLGENLRYIFQPFFEDDKIFIVPNGANYVFPHKNVEESRIFILYFSNLQASKGIEDVVASLKFLPKGDLENIFLNVIGKWRNDGLRKKCQTIVKDHNLPVKFFEPLSGSLKWQHFANADIFVFPPREPEGHPWVIVEAMAAGLPIISTDQGAITESVLDGINGFIVNPYNPNQMAEKISYLINNIEARTNMGRKSRQLYEEKFTEEIMIRNLEKVFDIVLSA